MWERLLRWLGFPPLERGVFRLEGALAEHVYHLARRERRSPDDMAADLVTSGLLYHSLAHEQLERWRDLSLREQQVSALICLGYTNYQIADRLVIAPATVKSHVRNILRKFDLHSQKELRLMLQDWDFRDWEA
ncbi:MAG: LuxR C-terminal-related transcriptional regulator [Chloroflexota bacterium]